MKLKLKERMQNSFFALPITDFSAEKSSQFHIIIVPCFYSGACDNDGMVYRKRYGKY